MATDIKQLTQADLDHFPATGTLYKHSLCRDFHYTEGVRFMAIKAGASWLIDQIIGAQQDDRIKDNQRLQEFQVWELVLSQVGCGATLVCREDSDCDPAISKHIHYTDFPLSSIKLFYSNSILYLPSEH